MLLQQGPNLSHVNSAKHNKRNNNHFEHRHTPSGMYSLNILRQRTSHKRRVHQCWTLYMKQHSFLSSHNSASLLPDDFAEYIYHIGKAFEMHSIIKIGLIPGGKSIRRDRQSVFFTAVNPMDARQDQREVEYDLDKPRIAPNKHTWKAHNTVHWCNLKLAQRKGLRFYQTRSHAITLSSTLPAILKEKVVFVKTGKKFLQSVSVTEATSSNTCADLATCSKRCTYYGFEKIR